MVRSESGRPGWLLAALLDEGSIARTLGAVRAAFGDVDILVLDGGTFG